MKNLFHYSRFERLFVKHTVEHYRNYLMSALLILGMTAVLYSFLIWTSGGLKPSARFGTLSFFYILSGCIFTSSIFSDFTQKSRAIGALILPASHLEKFLVGWIYSFIIFQVVFGVCFGVVDYLFVTIAPAKTENLNLYEAIPENGLIVIFFIYTVLHGVVLFGSAYFKKLHFVKTALYLFAVIVFMCIFHQAMLNLLIPGQVVSFNPPFLTNGVSINSDSQYYRVMLEKPEMHLYNGILITGITLSFWCACYFQIKEKQI